MLSRDELLITKLQLKLLHQIAENCHPENFNSGSKYLRRGYDELNTFFWTFRGEHLFSNLSNQILLDNIIAFARTVEIALTEPSYETRLLSFFKRLETLNPSSCDSLTKTTQELIQFKKPETIPSNQALILKDFIGPATLIDQLKRYLNNIKENSFNAETVLSHCAQYKNRSEAEAAVYWACKFKHDDILLSLLQFLDFDKDTCHLLLNFACKFNNKHAINALLKKNCEKFNWTIEEGLVEYICQSENHLYILEYLSSQDLLSTEAIRKGLFTAAKCGVDKVLDLLATNDMKLLALPSSFFLNLMEGKIASTYTQFGKMLENKNHNEKYLPFLANRNVFFPVVEGYPIPYEIYTIIASFYHALQPFNFSLSPSEIEYEHESEEYESSAEYEDSTEEGQDYVPGM